MRPEIGDTSEGLRGGASRGDLETMFQLVYLTFTQPRADQEAFATYIRQLQATLANRQAMPDAAFDDAVEAAVTQNHLRARPLSPDLLPQLNLQKSLAFYKDRFADASDFTFVFVGNIDVNAFKPLVERYLASLPATNRRETVRDVGIRPPAGVVERQLAKGLDPAESGQRGVHRPVRKRSGEPDHRPRDGGSARGQPAAHAARGSRRHLRRQRAAAVHRAARATSTGSRSSSPATPRGWMRWSPRSSGSSISSEQLGPSRAQTSDVRAALIRDLETNSRDNAYLLNQLTYKYQYGEDPAEAFNLEKFYDLITPAALQKAAQTYLDTKRYVKVTLVPAAGARN